LPSHSSPSGLSSPPSPRLPPSPSSTLIPTTFGTAPTPACSFANRATEHPTARIRPIPSCGTIRAICWNRIPIAALVCLDEFPAAHAESDIEDPLKRAILRHVLWAVFDWAAEGHDRSSARERRELCARLAELIRRLALTTEKIRPLPDDYAAAVAAWQLPAACDLAHPQQAFLPAGLFRRDGPRVSLSAHTQEPAAIVRFTGRSR